MPMRSRGLRLRGTLVVVATAALLGCRALIGADSLAPVTPLEPNVPAPLPAHMLVGLLESDGAWMGKNDVGWDVRWDYFASFRDGRGWYNRWVSGSPTTSWAVDWLQGVVNQGFIPAVQY